MCSPSFVLVLGVVLNYSYVCIRMCMMCCRPLRVLLLCLTEELFVEVREIRKAREHHLEHLTGSRQARCGQCADFPQIGDEECRYNREQQIARYRETLEGEKSSLGSIEAEGPEVRLVG